MSSSNVWVCPKCKFVETEDCLNADHRCEYCNSICVDTNKTYDEWDKLFCEKYPEKDNPNTSMRELFDFCADVFLNEYNTVDTESVSKREKATQEWLDELDKSIKSKPVSCPKCGSTSISTQKRGFKLGRAIAGAALTGFLDVGAVAGAAGSNKMINVCQRCGHQWEPR